MRYDHIQAREADEQSAVRSRTDDELGACELTEVDLVLPADRFPE